MRIILAFLILSVLYRGAASAQTFSFAFGSAGIGAGEFDVPAGIAVDSSSNIYVVDGANNRIQKFNSKGDFLLMWGWGVKNSEEKLQTCT